MTCRKFFIDCSDKEYSSKITQHGNYWLLRNYVKASKYVKCDETITYTTHCDLRFLDNVTPLLERWRAPISVAVWAPGYYFEMTLKAISFLRNCQEESSLVREFATFHLFFDSENFPKSIPQSFEELEKSFKCSENINVSISSFKNLTYPINVARNLARDAALTHFLLSSDIELYPSPDLIERFFKMLEINSELLRGKK